VLACIESYLPIYRSVTRYPNVADDVIAGTAERRSVAELHRAAWQIVQPQIAARTAAAIARYQSVVGTGNTADTILEVLAAARDGRVARLFVTDGAPMWGCIDEHGNVSVAQARSISDEDLVDRAVFETLAHNGEVIFTDPDSLGVNTVVAAVFRY
jgi:translation initiation factor 2B subunit (eIF-2B alpha/beta/delta family)